ncbi:unnamed protein product [Dicrocoelium dendriticum]|nr:unnamed protein product [Dicrocoelium dendriticum]
MPSEDEQARDPTFLRGPEVPNKRRYHLLAEILPPPPDVPLPAEPPFDANELFKLTFGNKLPKFLVQVDEFTQILHSCTYYSSPLCTNSKFYDEQYVLRFDSEDTVNHYPTGARMHQMAGCTIPV